MSAAIRHTALTEPQCLAAPGYPVSQLESELTVEELEDLTKWMYGQTSVICNGRKYNHMTREYEPSECSEHAHGEVYFSWDVSRWLNQLDPLD